MASPTPLARRTRPSWHWPPPLRCTPSRRWPYSPASATRRLRRALAGPTAQRLGARLLLAPEGDGAGDSAGVRAELARLGADTVLAVDDAARAWKEEWGAEKSGAEAAKVVTDETALPAVRSPEPRPSVLVLAHDSATQLAGLTGRVEGSLGTVAPPCTSAHAVTACSAQAAQRASS